MKKKLLFGSCSALFLGMGITAAALTTQSANAQFSKLSLDNIEALDEKETCFLICPDASKDGYQTVGCFTTPCAVEDAMTMRCGSYTIVCY